MTNIKLEKSKLWFRAKNYGWGWYPCSWEGWTVLLIWVLLFFSFVKEMKNEIFKDFIFILI